MRSVTRASALAVPALVQLNGTVQAPSAADALLGMLFPFWQLVLGVVILGFLAATAGRLARRGRSRMNTALVVTGFAVLGLVLLGMLTVR